MGQTATGGCTRASRRATGQLAVWGLERGGETGGAKTTDFVRFRGFDERLRVEPIQSSAVTMCFRSTGNSRTLVPLFLHFPAHMIISQRIIEYCPSARELSSELPPSHS